MKAIIIDDEKKGRQSLKQKLNTYCAQVEVLGEAENGEQGIQLINQFHPEIVFLDIEMPRMDGFQMLHRLPEKNFHLIFTTAYDQYAIKAIKYSALDYLLKPIDIDELKATISRITPQAINQTGLQLDALESNFKGKSGFKKIAIPTQDGLLFFNADDIIHLEANSNYTTLYFTNRPKLTASKTLKDFEELLTDDIFFRPHHSHIINLNYIKRYSKGDGGQIEMQNGNMVIVSRRRKDDFLRIIGH